MTLNHFREQGSFEPTDGSKAILKDARDRLNAAMWDEHTRCKLHDFASRNVFDLVGLSDLYGGAYLSNDGIDEFCNEIEAVVDLDFAEELYACHYDDEAMKDPESAGYRSFATDVDLTRTIAKHLRELDVDVLKLCADIRPLYFSDLFGDETISGQSYDFNDGADAVDMIVAIADKIIARLQRA